MQAGRAMRECRAITITLCRQYNPHPEYRPDEANYEELIVGFSVMAGAAAPASGFNGAAVLEPRTPEVPGSSPAPAISTALAIAPRLFLLSNPQ